jgi:hypothetical protein
VAPEDGVDTLEGAATMALWGDRFARRGKDAANRILSDFGKKVGSRFYE